MAGAAGSQRSVQVRIEGRVQGVGYRAWTADEARTRGMRGWVRNRRDGAVEAVLAGPADVVAEMLERCAAGPPAARVTNVAIIAEAVAAIDGFSVLPTL